MDLESLRRRVDVISAVNKAGFWVTNDELCDLLEIPAEVLAEVEQKYHAEYFFWRNFQCMRKQGNDGQVYWNIMQLDSGQLPQPHEHASMQSGQQLNDRQSSAASQAKSTSYVQMDNVFDDSWVENLLSFVMDSREVFSATQTDTNTANYRKSNIMHQFQPFSANMIDKVRELMPGVLASLNMEPFTISDIEAQLTQHNDGDFYRVHNDNGSPVAATRALTYVYYFYRQPKVFMGGELRIYDTVIKDGFYAAAETFSLVEPRRNSIVFFQSHSFHEVLPITCPSGAFEDSRFTINGWVRR